jgi:hypothetical protein
MRNVLPMSQPTCLEAARPGDANVTIVVNRAKLG